MKSKRVTVLLTALLAAAPALPAGFRELKKTATVPVPNQFARAIFGPAKCDASSDVYAQVYREETDPWNNPVLKISPAGTATVFRAAPVGGEKLDITSFSPAPGGGAALLARDPSGSKYYLQLFGEDGKLESSSAMPATLDPLQVAASASGNFLITGLSSDKGVPGSPGSKLFAGVFDSSGQLEYDVALTDDIGPSGLVDNLLPAGAPSPGPLAPGSPREFGAYLHALQFSEAVGMENGGFLLARLSTGGPIHIISPGGADIDNGFRPSLPGGSILFAVGADGNDIVVTSFRKKPESNDISDLYVTLWDASTRREVSQFHTVDPSLGAELGCYQNGVFTFLTTTESGNLQLAQATGVQP